MKEKYKTKLIAALKNHNTMPVIAHALRNRWPIWIINNKSVRYLQLEDRTYKILKKKYRNIINNATKNYGQLEKAEKIIWICWLQGIENAPLLVKRCVDSVYENFPEFDIRIIDEKNMLSYIDIPDYVLRKWKNGIIPNAQFSDIIRILLLAQYGGTWIDATVYCTGNEKAEKLLQNSLFTYKLVMHGSGRIVASNWLISAGKNNPIIVLTKNLVLEYWKKENIMINYLFFHIFFTLATEKYPEIWSNVPTFNNVSPHIMANEINKEYSQERFRELQEMSDFHKLNYKSNLIDDNFTLYSHVLHHRKAGE